MGLETAALIAAGVSAAATVASGVSQFRQAQTQATVERQRADFTQKQAQVDADEFYRRQRRLLASARAARGASGVDLMSGSPLLVDDDTIEEIMFQTERIRQGGEVDAIRSNQQASMLDASGQSALAGSVLQGGSTFLTTGYGNELFSSRRASSKVPIPRPRPYIR